MNNPFYNPSGNPMTLSRGASALLRAEFQAIANGFAGVTNIGGLNSGLDTGTANTIVITPSPAMNAYGPFVQMTFVAATTNTGPATINANGLGPIPITRRDRTPLAAGDIVAGGVYTVVGDGNEVQLQANPLSGTATGAINTVRGNSVASALTVSLDGATGNYLHITGSNTISGITLAAGSMRQVVFDGSLTLVNSAGLILPGQQSITTAAGDSATFYGDAGGVVRCVSYVPIAAPSSTLVVPNGYIYGFGLANNGTNPATAIDIAAGLARDSANAATIGTVATMTKSLSGTWGAGSGNGGRAGGVGLAPKTWYHVFAIIVSAAADFYFDTSLTAANKPAGTSSFRYVGSIKTDGSSNILAFGQFGQKFVWSTPQPDLLSTASGGVLAVTLSVPPGIVTFPILVIGVGASDNGTASFSVKSGYSGAVDGNVVCVGTVFSGSTQIQTTTNTSAQVICAFPSNNGGSSINTIGYLNPRVASVM